MTEANADGRDVAYDEPEDDDGLGLMEIASILSQHWRIVLIGPLVIGLLAFGISYLIAPTFTARTTFLPPQQQQSSAAAALASVGALAGLVGGGGALKSPADQYVALMQSVTVSDRLIDAFKLMSIYDVKYRFEARKALAKNVKMEVGKKDGLISVEVDDESPQRAADLANRYVDELRRMTSGLAVTEAQQRRVFFERQMAQTKDKLTEAQIALQASGIGAGALKAEPKTAADEYARLKAQLTAGEVRFQSMRGSLSDDAPEMRKQLATISALRAQLEKTSQASQDNEGPDYIGKYRDFKYQETLFDLFARQYEIARVDESREGALIQVVDPAILPEVKSKPKRKLIFAGATLIGFLVLALWVILRHQKRLASEAPPSRKQTV